MSCCEFLFLLSSLVLQRKEQERNLWLLSYIRMYGLPSSQVLPPASSSSTLTAGRKTRRVRNMSTSARQFTWFLKEPVREVKKILC